MATNDQVTVDIQEIENVLLTSPQEHNEMDTTTTSQNQLSHEEIVEIKTSSPQDEADGSKNESFEEIGKDVTTKHVPFEEREEHVTHLPHEYQADYWKKKQDLELLLTAARNNDWDAAYRDVFKGDQLICSNYFSALIEDDKNTLLHYATKRNSFLFVKELVKYLTEDQLTIKDGDGNTAFFVVASEGMVEFAKVMFEKNEQLPTIRGRDYYGYYSEMLPIHVAAQQGHKEMVEFLYGVQEPLEEIDSNRLFLNVRNEVSLFDDPMINEDLEKLDFLTRRDDWNTAFRDIFKKDPIENSKYLTARISKNEDTALHIAIGTKSFTFAKELIKYMKREHLAIKNGYGKIAFSLDAAFENGLSREIVPENVEFHPLTNQAESQNLRIKRWYGEISYAAMFNLSNAAMEDKWFSAFEVIFKKDPFKNSKYLTAKISKEGNTALHLATMNNSVRFARNLIEYMLKEELTIKNNDGDTAFLLAAEKGWMDVAMMMFKKNRWLPSIRGYSDDLPIHRAAKSGHREMVKFLYEIQGPLQEIDDSRLFINLRNRVSLFGGSYDSWTINRNLERLYKAASSNDWDGAYKDIFKSDPLKYSTYLTARVSEREDTILHIAAKTKSFMFFEELLKYMKKEYLAIKNTDGNSAFFLIAASGDVRLAEEMFVKNVELPTIRGEKEMLPIHKANEQGHKLMVAFLYGIQGPLEEMDSNRLSDYWKTDKRIIKKLYGAALNDDWRTAKQVYEEHQDYTKAIISEKGETALHVAVSEQSSTFAQNLINKMNPKDLEIKNHDGNTPFCLAATLGNLEIAKKMFDKNRELRSIRGGKEMLPINIAAMSGHKDIVKFLYEDFLSISNEDKYLNEEDQCKLIHNLIRTGIYDIALKLLKENPELAICREEFNGETALHILARKPNFPNKKGSGSDKVRHEKLSLDAHELVKLLWQQIRDLNLDEDKISEIIDHPWPVIFDAVDQQNSDFLAILIREFPQLTLRDNGNKYSIFHVAVLNHQKEIFELIDNIDPQLKKSILEKKDDEGNNILHLAGRMPSEEWLNNVLYVALQLQQELFWFKEVSKIVDPVDVEAKNYKGKTPTDLLNEKINDLKDKGEKWMKEIANSCMIVATLITTVAFAAAFTVPGGTKDDTGTPRFIQKVSFIIFVISDAIALASSSWSILTILSIYTARYTNKDFVLLPRNVVFGLSTLFLSIAAIMVVFCATIFIVFKDGKIWVPTLASLIASLPVISFTKQHQQLFHGVARLTFENSFLSKTIKKWKNSSCWNFLEECWDSTCSTFFEYFRVCCYMFCYYCLYFPFNFCRKWSNRLLSCCRDMCSKDM